jgi:TPR repeat protein
LSKRAEQASAEMLVNYARLAQSDGTKQGYAKAAEWLRKAAEQGNASAQAELGGLYFRGEGVKKDKANAIEWFKKAAAQGHEGAQRALEQIKGR